MMYWQIFAALDTVVLSRLAAEFQQQQPILFEFLGAEDKERNPDQSVFLRYGIFTWGVFKEAYGSNARQVKRWIVDEILTENAAIRIAASRMKGRQFIEWVERTNGGIEQPHLSRYLLERVCIEQRATTTVPVDICLSAIHRALPPEAIDGNGFIQRFREVMSPLNKVKKSGQ